MVIAGAVDLVGDADPVEVVFPLPLALLAALADTMKVEVYNGLPMQGPSYSSDGAKFGPVRFAKPSLTNVFPYGSYVGQPVAVVFPPL